MSEFVLLLLRVSLSATALALVIFALRPVLKAHSPAAFRYYLWLIVLLRLALPFGYGLDVNFAEAPETTQSEELLSAETDGVPAADNAASNVAGMTDSGVDTVKPADGTQTVKAGTGLTLAQTLAKYASAIWLTGAAASLLWYALSYAAFCRKIRRTSFTADGADTIVFDELRRGARVKMICSESVDTPLLMGVFNPTVVLPQSGYCAAGCEEQLKFMLSHELMHLKRRDTLYKWLTVIITSLHWFNPLMYFLRPVINSDCERSCDEAVIRNMTGEQRRGYGNTLLRQAGGRRLPSGAVATTLCVGKAQLKGRLLGILNYKKAKPSAVALMTVLALALSGCAAVLPGASEAKPSARWQEAVQKYEDFYFDELNTHLPHGDEDWTSGGVYALSILDLDFNDVPELIVYLSPNELANPVMIFTIENGELCDFTNDAQTLEQYGMSPLPGAANALERGITTGMYISPENKTVERLGIISRSRLSDKGQAFTLECVQIEQPDERTRSYTYMTMVFSSKNGALSADTLNTHGVDTVNGAESAWYLDGRQTDRDSCETGYESWYQNDFLGAYSDGGDLTGFVQSLTSAEPGATAYNAQQRESLAREFFETMKNTPPEYKTEAIYSAEGPEQTPFVSDDVPEASADPSIGEGKVLSHGSLQFQLDGYRSMADEALIDGRHRTVVSVKPGSNLSIVSPDMSENGAKWRIYCTDHNGTSQQDITYDTKPVIFTESMYVSINDIATNEQIFPL